MPHPPTPAGYPNADSHQPAVHPHHQYIHPQQPYPAGQYHYQQAPLPSPGPYDPELPFQPYPNNEQVTYQQQPPAPYFVHPPSSYQSPVPPLNQVHYPPPSPLVQQSPPPGSIHSSYLAPLYPLPQPPASPPVHANIVPIASPSLQHQQIYQQQLQAQVQISPDASPVAHFPPPSPNPPNQPAPQDHNISSVPRIKLRVNGGKPFVQQDMTVTRRRSSVKEESMPSTRHSNRRSSRPNYNEDGESESDNHRGGSRNTRSRRINHGDEDDAEGEPEHDAHIAGTRRSSRTTKQPLRYHDEDDFENSIKVDSSPVEPSREPSRRSGRSGPRRVVLDPDDEEQDDPIDSPQVNGTNAYEHSGPAHTARDGRPRRSQRGKRQQSGYNSEDDAESFAPSETDKESSHATSPEAVDFEDDPDDMSVSDSPPPRRATRQTRSSARRSTRSKREREPDSDDEYGAAGRSLRKRDSRPNYALPPMDISAEMAAADVLNQAIAAASGPRGRGRPGLGRGALKGVNTLPWSMKGKDWAQAMGDPDSSDSDADLPGPGNAAVAAGQTAMGRAGAAGPNIPGPTDVPNFGRINPKSNMADADPLGVDVNVTFDRVGGLDDHINQLKEMVALPLLYPELFQQFGITPPRGVLFHGPPGTGKTLLARALAASCSNGNTKIAFFMRKGADVLSKWVGEAERQLRMLFEEARASQPSIIFFDEIDGLAPVRSSKQDQIHASLVSTLLALMDGMDGRGQVIVIGATNRPDAVDPALRRPGRFDREFYFPLPNRDARRQIIGINTRNWEPPLPDNMLDTLATLTKGYGGADLRALCTEAALNAIQRRYPQIYKTSDRLQVQAGSVRVQPKDFMLAVKKIVPSSARSASSAAIQLPNQLQPLLGEEFERLKTAVDLALPRGKKRTALEEAEFEDDDGDSFEKEMMLQTLDKLRTYRPRLLVYGPEGAGQTYLGPAILHHLEGFHVQSFDLATLMGDSTRTPEAAIVQMFVEAKRHQPSIMFIPSLAQWSETLSETARSTTRALLDSIAPSDPVLLLAFVDGPVNTLPPDVRAWFGFTDENRIELGQPDANQRRKFFTELLESVQRPPTSFPDGVPRKKRVLESLPLAAPLPPRKPTEGELQREVDRDNAARNMIFVSFSSLVAEFMRKYRKPVTLVKEEAFAYANYLSEQAAAAAYVAPEVPAEIVDAVAVEPVNGDAAGGLAVPLVPEAELVTVPEPVLAVEPTPVEGEDMLAPAEIVPEPTAPVDAEPAAPIAPTWQAHNMDIETIQRKLVRHKYCTPADFLADIALIEDNAKHTGDAERQIKIFEMAAHARMHVQGFDPKWNPEFERYAARTRERKADKAKAKAASQAASKAASQAPDGTETEDAAASSKRAREGDDDDENDRAKRPRDDAMQVDPSDPIESVEDPTQATALESIRSPLPTPMPSGLSPTQITQPLPDEPVRSPTPEPEPVYPPLVCPQEELRELSDILTNSTNLLNVEELEQLRASLLDRVWRGRAEWDRTRLLGDMCRAARRFVQEVQEVQNQSL